MVWMIIVAYVLVGLGCSVWDKVEHGESYYRVPTIPWVILWPIIVMCWVPELLTTYISGKFR